MRTKVVAAAALALLGVSGPLLLVGLSDLPVLALAGVAAAWLGSSAAVLVVLVVLRDVQRRAGRTAGVPKQLTARLDADRAHLDEQLAVQRDEILRIVDARLLGLHAATHADAADAEVARAGAADAEAARPDGGDGLDDPGHPGRADGA